ncbi:MAG: diguanylate cyclase [Desulfobulbaceae bacterium]|nr:diguanylate cyclase [Desulfobulbaceae bacterium]
MTPQILVVDNNPVFLKLMTNFLKKEGYEVLTASNGLHALDILEKTKPDIIFVDLVMPTITGSKICQIIRSKPEFDDVILIVLSATTLEDEEEILFSCNADAYIAKGPFKELSKNISQFIENFEKKEKDTPQNKIIGTEGIYKRQVTKELLCLLRHRDFVLENMNDGVIEFTTKNKIIYINKSALSMLDIKEENVLGKSFIDLLPTELPKNIEKILSRNRDGCLDETIKTYVNNKYITIGLISIFVDEHKSYVAILKDITEQTISKNALIDSEKQYRDLVENSSDIIQSISTDGKIIYANNAWRKALGYSVKETGELNIAEIIHPDCFQHCMDKFRRIMSGEEISHIEAVFLSKDKKKITLEGNVNCKFVDGKPTSTRGIFRDITERKELEQKLQKLSITDEMTGLLNRRGFFEFVTKQFEIADRNKTKLFIFFADLDALKWINDNLGHNVGDQVIIDVANILRETFRKSDIIGRLGGDEFAVLQTDQGENNLKKLMFDRLENNIEMFNNSSEHTFKISLSVGITQYDPNAPCSLEDLLKEADALMYQHKNRKKMKQNLT